MNPAAWKVGTKVFLSLHEAKEYWNKFTHHKIVPLYEGTIQ